MIWKNVNKDNFNLYLSIGQQGLDGIKGEKGLSVKGESGLPGRPGYIIYLF